MAKDKSAKSLGGNIEYKDQVDPTKCKTRSQSRLVKTPHGVVKVIESVPIKKGGKS